MDEDFAKWSCEASRKWNLFNFFTDSTVNSLSNCCRLKSDVTELYFNSISDMPSVPSGELDIAIRKQWGSLEKLLEDIKKFKE